MTLINLCYFHKSSTLCVCVEWCCCCVFFGMQIILLYFFIHFHHFNFHQLFNLFKFFVAFWFHLFLITQTFPVLDEAQSLIKLLLMMNIEDLNVYVNAFNNWINQFMCWCYFKWIILHNNFHVHLLSLPLVHNLIIKYPFDDAKDHGNCGSFLCNWILGN